MSERNPPGAGFEIPDLELAPAVSKRPTAQSPQTAQPLLKPKPPEFGLEITLPDEDEFESLQLGSNVELSLGTSPEATRRHLATAEWPSGRTRAPNQLPIDTVEVAVVAGFGEAPKSALSAPLYAYRVLARRAPLKRAVTAQHALLAEAELARDKELAQLTTELRPRLEIHETFKRLLEPIREIERLAGERNAALSEVDSGYREQMARFDAELSTLREAQTKAEALSTEKSAAKDGSDNLLRRAEAKQQRLQIEIRSVLDLARQAVGPEGGDIPAPQATQLAELRARAKAFEPELAQAKSAYQAAGAALDQVDAELRRLRGQLQKLERQKNSAGSTLEQQISVRTAGVTEAEKQRRDALAEVARAVLAARGSLPVAEPVLDSLRHHERTVDALAIRLETHVRALDSHDAERVKQGVIVVLLALGVVLLSILLKAML